MRKLILLIGILFISCHKKEGNQPEKTKESKIEKGEYWSDYDKKESLIYKYKTDSMNLFFFKNQLNRVELKIFSESYGGDSPSSYIRNGYHINRNNFFDALVYIKDTLTTGNKGLDYPIEYEEYYDFYREKYTFSYTSRDGKNIENYFKSDEKPSKGYFADLLSLDITLAKANFSSQKIPKSIYEIKNNKDELYANQDSLKIYELGDYQKSKYISSSSSFKYLRDIKVKKVGSTNKYFAKILIKKEGLKYIDLKEIESVLVTNPSLESERFVTNKNGLEIYDDLDGDKNFGNKKYVLTKVPKGERVEITPYSKEYFFKDGKKGSLVRIIYYNKYGEPIKGIAFSGYLSINKPE